MNKPNRNTPDHYFVLPVTSDLPDETVASLSSKIRSLPANPNLSIAQRRLIDMTVPLLFSAGLFLTTVTIHQLTDLYRNYAESDEINHIGAGRVVDSLFKESESVVSGIYLVERTTQGYRFQFNPTVYEIIQSIQ